MVSTCMICRKEIAADDLGTKTCFTFIEKEINPFFVPIVACEPIHISKYLCGHCANEKSACPCCHGVLIAREEIISATTLFTLAQEAFTKLNLPGKFRCVSIMEKELYLSYALNGSVYEMFWREL